MMQFILPTSFIFLGLFTGIIGEKVVIKKLKKFVVGKQIPGNQIIFRALHRMTFIWLSLGGCFAAILSYPLKENLEDVLKRVITIVFLYSVTLVCARLAAGFVTLFLQKSEGVSASLLSNLAKIAIIILGTLIILQTMGVQVTAIVTTLGVGGLAVGLALQDTLANLFAGFYLIISKQVRTGDYIKLDGAHEGYVIDISWRNTIIKELSNNVVIIPNSKLSTAIFTNYNLPVKEVTVTVELGVAYDSDLEKVEKITVAIAQEVMQEVSPEQMEYEPFIRFHRFGDSSIDFTLFMRVNEFFDQRLAKHLFVKKLHKRYIEEGIKIPYPIQNIYLHKNGKGNGNGNINTLTEV
ncbi:mechanosensitive ion channel family protein [Calothrix sp. 336/3]|uniref:mechanosensitive ion channel family protein n=1 Tax=Calothrix sp. 336/3 TaxID=1337936 RepID=UPI0004E44D82|nr:mechanosensitive ion channel family protein [Calothrix sp. 336/3]AKG24812.1 mechanosensitive ion channel protein MscS [Calothrix sp. 336/3]